MGRAPKAYDAVAIVQILSSPNFTLGVVNTVSRPGIFHSYLVLALKTIVC